MKRIVLKAAAMAVAASAGSLLLVITVVPAIGGVVEGNAILMTLLCPLATAFPVSGYTFWQKQRVADAYKQLAIAHEQLADAHMQLADAHARLAEKARHDDMTMMLNRESFFAALNSRRRKTDVGVLLIIDADNFKYINDTHGHQQGDAALRLISDAIRSALRQTDVAGRIGGEEFAVFLGDTSAEEAMVIAERIRLGVEAVRFSPGEGKYLPLSVSIGAARLRPHLNLSQLMHQADRRLYEAKRQGRNRVVFEKGTQMAA